MDNFSRLSVRFYPSWCLKWSLSSDLTPPTAQRCAASALERRSTWLARRSPGEECPPWAGGRASPRPSAAPSRVSSTRPTAPASTTTAPTDRASSSADRTSASPSSKDARSGRWVSCSASMHALDGRSRVQQGCALWTVCLSSRKDARSGR